MSGGQVLWYCTTWCTVSLSCPRPARPARFGYVDHVMHQPKPRGSRQGSQTTRQTSQVVWEETSILAEGTVEEYRRAIIFLLLTLLVVVMAEGQSSSAGSRRRPESTHEGHPISPSPGSSISQQATTSLPLRSQVWECFDYNEEANMSICQVLKPKSSDSNSSDLGVCGHEIFEESFQQISNSI